GGIATRLNTDGSVDGTFGSLSGFLFVGGGCCVGDGYGKSQIAIQSDGKIIIDTGGVISRLNANGTTDFNYSAIIVPNGPTYFGYPNASIALTSTNKLVAVTVSADGYLSVRRFNQFGFVDSTFGASGEALIQFFNNSITTYDNPNTSVAIQSDGKILAGVTV